MKQIPYDVFAAGCPSRSAFLHIFSRWGVLILARLQEGPARFGTLSRSIEGISERMLSKSLKLLEEEGLVYRRELEKRPPHVEYGLTDAGTRIAEGILYVIQQLYAVMDSRGSTLSRTEKSCEEAGMN